MPVLNVSEEVEIAEQIEAFRPRRPPARIAELKLRRECHVGVQLPERDDDSIAGNVFVDLVRPPFDV